MNEQALKFGIALHDAILNGGITLGQAAKNVEQNAIKFGSEAPNFGEKIK